jgi:two-component system, LuxR family, response regulator FixJ
VKGFHEFARHHNWLVCKVPRQYPTQASRRFADLSHIKVTVLILVLFAAHRDRPEPWAKAKPMKNQGALSNSGLVVIVISDDLAVRNSLKFWLEIEGLTVRGYVSGADLLDAGDLARCDCYVVDQKMSVMSGLDLIAQLRDRHFAAPAILIASHPSRSLREQAEKADIPIVEKPLLGNGLLDKIRDVVGGRG